MNFNQYSLTDHECRSSFPAVFLEKEKGMYIDSLPIIYRIQSEVLPIHFRADAFYLHGFSAVCDY